MMYVPSDIDSPYWQQLAEWMTEHDNPQLVMLQLFVEQRTSAPGQPQVLKLASYAPDSKYHELWVSPLPISAYAGKWIKVDFYVKQGRGDAEVKMWMDDKLMYDGTGLNLRQYAPSLQGDWGQSFHLGLYAYEDPPADVWYDNVYVANYRETAPVVTVPADVTVDATGAGGTVVAFTASALDAVDGSLTPTCTPSSGSTFAIGLTKVACSATDKAGNSASASFKVSVGSLDESLTHI